MADTFGIFMEDTMPAVYGVLKDAPTVLKGKGNFQHIKKKALGDVSNTVSQKVLNTQHPERGGKLLGDSCCAAQEDVSTSCKPVSDVKETAKETPDGCTLCCQISEFDYDIAFKSQRLTSKEIDPCSLFYSHQPFSLISSSSADFDLPDLSTPTFVVPLPFDESQDFSPSDVSLPSLDELDFCDFDVSF